MRKISVVLVGILLSVSSFSQDAKENFSRFIEVTGSAEKEVKPDVILFDIGVQEYYKEEYETGKDYKDYTTKISLDDIEKELMAEIAKLGVTKEQVTIVEGNNYSKINGKSFMGTKTIQVNLTDLKKVNELIQKIKSKGVSYMRISSVKNKDINQFVKQVKVDAMKDAKSKATYLLESVGNTLGQVISVIEIDNSGIPLSAEDLNNMSAYTAQNNNQNDLKNENLVVKYKVKVRFEIK